MPPKKYVQWGTLEVRSFARSKSPVWKRNLPPKYMPDEVRHVHDQLLMFLKEVESQTYQDVREMVVICGNADLNGSALHNIVNGSVLHVFMRLLDANKDIIKRVLGISTVHLGNIKMEVVKHVINDDVTRNTIYNSSTKSRAKQTLRLAKEIIHGIVETTLDMFLELYIMIHR